MDIERNREKQRELREELERLMDEEAEYGRLPAEFRLAEYIHDTFCKQNHTDGCGWDYEKWQDPTHPGNGSHGWTHDRYLDIANKMLDALDHDEFVCYEAIKALKGA